MLSIFRAVIGLLPHFPSVSVWLLFSPSSVTFTCYCPKITVRGKFTPSQLAPVLSCLSLYTITINYHVFHQLSLLSSTAHGSIFLWALLCILLTVYTYIQRERITIVLNNWSSEMKKIIVFSVCSDHSNPLCTLNITDTVTVRWNPSHRSHTLSPIKPTGQLSGTERPIFIWKISLTERNSV